MLFFPLCHNFPPSFKAQPGFFHKNPPLPLQSTPPLGPAKSLAEFAARRRQRSKIIFSRDMCVRENTSQAASVEFVRRRRTNYARSRLQPLCQKGILFDRRKAPEAFASGASIFQKPRRVSPPQRRKKVRSFSQATCAAEKIPLGLQTCKLAARGGRRVRCSQAAKPLSKRNTF